jgi:hypothetical protein
MGFAARLAGRGFAQDLVILLGICSGLDIALLNIKLLPSTTVILLGFGFGAGQNNTALPQALTLGESFLEHSNYLKLLAIFLKFGK